MRRDARPLPWVAVCAPPHCVPSGRSGAGLQGRVYPEISRHIRYGATPDRLTHIPRTIPPIECGTIPPPKNAGIPPSCVPATLPQTSAVMPLSHYPLKSDGTVAEWCACRSAPFISPGEKQIACAALDAGLPLVALKADGFAPRYKPPGRYFDACATGRLLLLAPHAHGLSNVSGAYIPRTSITHVQCLALNRLAATPRGLQSAPPHSIL